MKRANVNVLLAVVSLFALALLLNDSREESAEIPAWGKIRLRADRPLNPIAWSQTNPLPVIRQPVYLPPRTVLGESAGTVSRRSFEGRSLTDSRVVIPVQTPVRVAVYQQDWFDSSPVPDTTGWKLEL